MMVCIYSPWPPLAVLLNLAPAKKELGATCWYKTNVALCRVSKLAGYDHLEVLSLGMLTSVNIKARPLSAHTAFLSAQSAISLSEIKIHL